MKAIDIPQIRDLSASEKLLLVENLWDDIAEKADLVEIPGWHKAALDQSAEEYKKEPREGSSWADVRKRILGRG
jgi:putative addiction module component (TIGR02574 family)